MRIAVISDTHVPSRATAIPDWVAEEVDAADHVVHAGDFDSPGAYERVRDMSRELTAVAGNMDPRNLDLDPVAVADLGGVRFVVTHGTGPVRTYEERVGGIVAEHAADGPTVGVSGHTHELMDEELGGHRVLNPGSATGAAPADVTSMLTVHAADGTVEVERHVR